MRLPTLLLIALALAISACSPADNERAHEDAEHAREQAQQAAQKAKIESKRALDQAEVDAAKANRELTEDAARAREKTRRALGEPDDATH